MGDPVLHVLAGPNGSGKSTLYARVLRPVTHLPFVNADLIAAARWPEPSEAQAHAYDAARLAAEERGRLIAEARSFVTETVFSHESKLDLLREARGAGYRTTLHVILVPEELAVARVRARAAAGGHDVPEDKIRSRFHRLWSNVREAMDLVDEARFYDNSSARRPFRLVAVFLGGRPASALDWPPWAPEALARTGQ